MLRLRFEALPRDAQETNDNDKSSRVDNESAATVARREQFTDYTVNTTARTLPYRPRWNIKRESASSRPSSSSYTSPAQQKAIGDLDYASAHHNLVSEVDIHSARFETLANRYSDKPRRREVGHLEVTNQQGVFNSVNARSQSLSSVPQAMMHFTTPSISWATGGGVSGKADLADMDVDMDMEDQDRFTNSDNVDDYGGDGGGSCESWQEKYEGGELGMELDSERIWMAGMVRNGWCRMVADVEERIRREERVEGYEERSMWLDGACEGEGEDGGACGSKERTKVTIEEFGEGRKVKSMEPEDEELRSMFGDDDVVQEQEVDLNDLESERTLKYYEERLTATIHRIVDAKTDDKEDLERERLMLISTVRLIRANVDAKKKRDQVVKTRELTAAIPLPLPGQEPDTWSREPPRKGLSAEPPTKRQREDDELEDPKLDTDVLLSSAPKRRKRRTADEIAADKEQKLKDKDAKAAAKIAAKKSAEEAKIAAKNAEREAKKLAKEAEKQRLKDEKAAEKAAKPKTAAQLANEAKRESVVREKIAKARGLMTGKPKGTSNWKAKAPWEMGRWNTRYEQAAFEQADGDGEQADVEPEEEHDESSP